MDIRYRANQVLDVKYTKNLITSIFLISIHVIGIIGFIYLYHYHLLNSNTIKFAVIYFFATALTIELGCHRCFTHRSYRPSLSVKMYLLLGSLAAMTNSVFIWSSEHRRHHRFIDKSGDPYNINRGFLHAHILWACENIPLDFGNIPDLMKDKLLILQHKFRVPLTLFFAIILPILICSLWGDPLGGVVIAVCLRLMATFHNVGLVNSICHFYGDQPNHNKDSSRNNLFVAIISFGGGYHNNHHAYPSDYRAGVKWYDFDLTKWIIKLLSWFKLTSCLRTQKRVVAQKPKNHSQETIIL